MARTGKNLSARWCSLVVCLGFFTTVLTGVAAAESLRADLYVGGLTRPVAFVQDPGTPTLQYVVEQGGRIRVIQNGVLVAAPFLDITASVASTGEQGLLGLALAPDYAASGRFFLYFTRADGNIVVARFRRSASDPLVADPASRFDLLWSTGVRYIEHSTYGNHNGGNLAFGPDGYLYLGTGDGGGAGDPQNHAQSASSLLGKMLRIDVNVPDSDPEGFDVPADNPFLGEVPAGARPEIWAVGLRNPWRWSFDDPARGGTGALIIGDIGQHDREEINYEPANRGGRNYGWSVREGSAVYSSDRARSVPSSSPLTDPVVELDTRFSTSLIGGFVYRGTRLGADYAGRYFFADFATGRVYSVVLGIGGDGEAVAGDFTDHPLEPGGIGAISAFGVDSDGELLVVSWSSGEILRLVPTAPLAATLVSPSGIITTVTPTYTWNAVSAAEWYYLWVTDQQGVRIQRWFTAAQVGCGSGTGTCSVTPPTAVTPGEVLWWIQSWNVDGYGPWSESLSFAPTAPAVVTTIAPSGSVDTAFPTYTWNASPLASQYLLWVDNAGATRVLTWFAAATVGCAGGTGTCTIQPNAPLEPGASTWWIQPWNEAGYGPFSAGRTFTIDAPGPATLVAPSGTISTVTPIYSWNAVADAAQYLLWVNNGGSTRIVQWYTAAAAGCGGGTGTCSVTPSVPLVPGAGTWWVQTWNEAGNGPWSAGLTFTVSLGPVFTSASTATFNVSVPGSFTVTTAGTPTPALSVTGTLPAGVTFVDNLDGTGTLAGMPAAGTAGAHSLTFTATNSQGTGTQSFTLNANEGPVITSASSATFAIGAVNTFTVTASGFPPPGLVQDGAALPSGVTWVDNGDGTGTLSGTPAAGTGGSYALTFTATNGSGSAVQNFTLNLTESPGFTSAATTTFTVGSAGTFTVTTVGTPTPALTVGALPSGVTFADNGDGTGTLSGTPAAGTGGVHALTFTAANGVLPDGTQAFTLNVNEGPAITSAAAATFTIGTPGAFTVTTSGLPVPTLAIGGVALPAGLTFVDNGNGTATLSGTAAAGTGGIYALTFTATNTIGASAPQGFTLTVNQAPAITSGNTANFTVGVPGAFTVTTTGFPVPTIARTGAALPTGVTFVDNGDGTGTLSGMPAAGTAAAYAFTFTATNSTSPAATQAFTLNVNQPPAITSAATTTFTVGTAASFTVTTTGFPTPTVSQTGALPAGVTFTPATRVLGGTATQTGAFPLVFTATNAIPPDATQNFTLNVVCPAITVTPLVMPDGLYQTVYAGVDFNQTGSTGTTFTWGATGLPAGLTIDVNTGVVSGTATNTVAAGGVAVTVTDNFGCQGTLNTAVTVRPTTDNENYTGGVGNTQYVTGAPFPSTPHVAFADDVKTGDAGPGSLSVTFPATSTNGGTIVEGTGDGTFTYTPAVAFAGPTDTFTYTLTDGNGVTNTGTVTINLSGMVWYVNSAGGAGDGRSHNPFNTLNAAATPSGSGSHIYVHTGGAATSGNLTMDANQTLHGQGAAFTLSGLTIAAGTRPTLTGTVTLANNTVVTAVNFGPSGIPAMTATAVTGPIGIDQVGVTGGTNSLSLTNVSGAVTVNNSSFSLASGAEVLINQGTGNVSIGATISSVAGRSIDVQNRTGGTVTFSGSITDTGQGIFLNANTGSTINFTGGLSLNTTTNPAFTATGGGTVSATQNNTTIVNTITTTTGTALNVANTTIGASGLTFRSIAANGATNGIVLNTTGAGALTVTGNSAGNCGGTVTVNTAGTPGTVGAPDIADCTGGTIQNTTSHGIALTGTTNTSLIRMRILNSGADGILVSNVNGFTLTRSYITDGAGVAGDRGIEMGDFSTGTPVNGTITIANSTLGPTPHDNFGIGIASGTSNWSINNTVFTGSTLNSGLNFEIRNATVSSFVINGCVFQNQFADGMQMQPASNVAANLTATIQNSTFLNNNLHLDLNHDGTGSTSYSVLANTFRSAQSHAFNLFSSAVQAPATGGTLDATISGNFVGTAGTASSGSVLGNGLRININGGVDATVLVNGNTVRQTPNGRGIEVISRNGTGGLDITATNNIFNNDFVTTPENQGFSLASAFFQSHCVTVCNTLRADIRLNTVPAAAPNGELLAAQLAIIETSMSTFQLVDSGAPSASCTAQLTENNTGNAAANAGCSLIPGPIDTP